MSSEMRQIADQYLRQFDRIRDKVETGIEQNRKTRLCLRVIDAFGQPVPHASVQISQTQSDFLFGCNALLSGQLGDMQNDYETLITRLFNCITTTCSINDYQPEPGIFRFASGSPPLYRRPPIDDMTAFAEHLNLKIKIQPLFADSWSRKAEWIPNDRESVIRVYDDYFRRIAERYGSRFFLADVVNEAFSCPRRNPDFCLLDESKTMVDLFFRMARKYFPRDVLLELNDGTGMNAGPQSDAYFRLAQRQIENKTGMNAIGFQCHLFNLLKHLRGEMPLQDMYDNYLRFSSLGVPLFITEVTLGSMIPGMTDREGEKLQAIAAEVLYRLWFSVPEMAGIIFWNLADGGAYGREGDAKGALADRFFREKPAYQVLYQLIRREWRTQADLETDENGEASVRVFRGRYQITAEIQGGRIAARCHTAPGDETVFCLNDTPEKKEEP